MLLQGSFFSKFLVKFVFVVPNHEPLVICVMKLVIEFLSPSWSTFFHVAQSWGEVLVSQNLFLEHFPIFFFLHSRCHYQHPWVQLISTESPFISGLHLLHDLLRPPQLNFFPFFTFSRSVHSKETVSSRNGVWQKSSFRFRFSRQQVAQEDSGAA